jgi:cbb3-type cytochrome oxidase subunit 3
MDLTLLRSLVTVGSFLAFLGIVFWAYRGRNREYLEAQGRLALDDEPQLMIHSKDPS